MLERTDFKSGIVKPVPPRWGRIKLESVVEIDGKLRLLNSVYKINLNILFLKTG